MTYIKPKLLAVLRAAEKFSHTVEGIDLRVDLKQQYPEEAFLTKVEPGIYNVITSRVTRRL
ncbi:MAG: hypothetical protein JXA46_10000 [Dehalococcoidales bacterium]|nr:hypothetical protein [Dehalococcoidales bacterium]